MEHSFVTLCLHQLVDDAYLVLHLLLHVVEVVLHLQIRHRDVLDTSLNDVDVREASLNLHEVGLVFEELVTQIAHLFFD